MKRILPIIATVLVCAISHAREYEVYGPQGGLATSMTLPDGFDRTSQKCPMVILMHGIFSSKDFLPMPQIAKSLAKQGIGSIRFDFGGHWHSEGKMVDMTIAKELEDAMAVYEYAASLPFVSEIALLGHSQGGVIASMTAGRLAAEAKAPAALVLLAPGSVIKEACQAGHFFKNTFDPNDPPEYIRCFGFFKLGREYMLSTQKLQIYETAAHFQGPVCIIHGDSDNTVPLWCSERFVNIYRDNEFHLIQGENHRLSKKTKEDVDIVTRFMAKNLNHGWTEDELKIIESANPLMKVYTIADPSDSLVLRSISRNLSTEMLKSPQYRKLADAMIATVTSPEQDGVGIAGPQVGILRRIVAVQRLDKENAPFEVYPNIRITQMRGELQSGPEGCLSVPGRRGDVMRSRDITISYTSPETLRDTTEVVQGFTAVIFQHETDHLDGTLYIDKL